MSLGCWVSATTGKSVKAPKFPQAVGPFVFDEDDYAVYALLTDPVYCAELLGEDPGNRAHAGCYVVRDYQYPLFRADDQYVGFACARSVGKTESILWRSVVHVFKRMGTNLLVTAPELNHLLPLTDKIEDKLTACRMTREFLDDSGQRTGFMHRPFGAKFKDGTQIVGRIPRISGTGVKGQHQPDLMIDEAQDYPAAGWTEVHETVMKDTVDADGKPDFHYHFYGVHSGARDTGFHSRTAGGGFKVVAVTAIQRYGWGKAEKDAARAAYGGTSASDYRRNILGEAGGASSPFFVLARLMACVDQERDKDGEFSSKYNRFEIRPASFIGDGGMYQRIRVEEFDELNLPMNEVIDLPSGYGHVHAGLDFGLAESPTVITIWAKVKVKGAERLKLIRRIHLERMRTKQIRAACYAIDNHFGEALKSFGMDITGLGNPIFQELEDDELCPEHLKAVARGYFFNAKVPTAVAGAVAKDATGRLRDMLGNSVVEEIDPNTNQPRYVTYKPMMEASTQYLVKWVDSTYLLLPFDPEIIADMTLESIQRVKRVGGMKSKPEALHILDSMRVMAMAEHADEVAEQLADKPREDVLDFAVTL